MRFDKASRCTTDEQKAATAASADAWRAQCAKYRAEEAAKGPPEIPSERVMLARYEAHIESANGSRYYSPRMVGGGTRSNVRVKRAEY